MTKNKYVVMGVVLVVLAGGVGASIAAWQHHIKQRRSLLARVAAARQQALGASTGSDSVPLTEAGSSDDTSGLKVSNNNNAAALGQFNGTGNDQNASTGSSSSSSGSSSPFNPSTFSQYDKYKDAPNALFGDVQKGTGDELAAGKKAVVVYKGWLTDGQLFDQSKPDAKGQMQAFAFTEGAHEVIPGWEEALLGMKAGGTRLLIVPPAAGYGDKGQGPIPPNAVLIFQVQLVAVQ